MLPESLFQEYTPPLSEEELQEVAPPKVETARSLQSRTHKKLLLTKH